MDELSKRWFTPAGLAEFVERTRRVERARILAIVSSMQAEGRPSLANYIAFRTSIPWAEALGILSATAIERAGWRSPEDEADGDRQSRIRRVGELTGHEAVARALAEETAVPSFHASTLIVEEATR